MSISTEITRIQNAKDVLKTKGVALGIATSTDNLTALATKFNNITDRGTPSTEISSGTSYTIQAGYYHGGTVKAVGEEISLQTKEVTPTKALQEITADDGYNGLEKVSVKAIPSNYQDVSDVTATDNDVLTGKIFVDSQGVKTTGVMLNRGAINETIDGLVKTSYTIPVGYHNGSGTVSLTNDIESALALI